MSRLMGDLIVHLEGHCMEQSSIPKRIGVEEQTNSKKAFKSSSNFLTVKFEISQPIAN